LALRIAQQVWFLAKKDVFLPIFYNRFKTTTMDIDTEKILITGALGQIGSELYVKLCEQYGPANVVVSDIRAPHEVSQDIATYAQLDVTDFDAFDAVLAENQITQVYHLASLLSATSEKNPAFARKLNLDTLLYLLEKAREKKISKLFWPSSIAVFGKRLAPDNVAQEVGLNPTTVYGITKLAGEKWCEYYHDQYGVDVRSLRYPGLISWKTPAGGGTTDYAVDIYYKAVTDKKFTCFLSENTALPMMYMDDAIDATLQLMDAPAEKLSVWTSYNLGGMSFTPDDVYQEIKKIYPEFGIDYAPDFRQQIADSWPKSIDDSVAKQDWNLSYNFDLQSMTQVMIERLEEKLKPEMV
jgi:nucleoside-diphosphate-sugar epimerase